uniref:Uncharacterized protein n=1 Tax=Rheinheimera sp. BAL341 TaxID=1708203 RepID=A0A486XTN7_9GAMM
MTQLFHLPHLSHLSHKESNKTGIFCAAVYSERNAVRKKE